MKENMYYGARTSVFKKAEELRNNMTSAERIIWNHIHINPWKLKFRRQHPISNFIADFYCHPIKLVIEIDGDVHDVEEVKQYDEAREKSLKELGLNILRFKNEEVFKNSTAVLGKIDQTISVLQSPPLGDGGGPLTIIKIGGNIIDDETKLSHFLKQFASVEGKKILVHGGGKLATNLAEQLNIPQQLVDGRRITDAETLKIVTMVYAGYINKNIVAQLQAGGENAIGICGADGNAILAHKRLSNSTVLSGVERGNAGIDYGFAGDIDEVNISLFSDLLEQEISIVVAPITHDGKRQLLNTNADTIAQEIAKALSKIYSVQLIYSFEKAGVLRDANDDATLIKNIDPSSYKQLKESGAIFAGMIPKLDNAFAALNNGVEKVIIGKAEELEQLLSGQTGTSITLNDHHEL